MYKTRRLFLYMTAQTCTTAYTCCHDMYKNQKNLYKSAMTCTIIEHMPEEMYNN